MKKNNKSNKADRRMYPELHGKLNGRFAVFGLRDPNTGLIRYIEKTRSEAKHVMAATHHMTAEPERDSWIRRLCIDAVAKHDASLMPTPVILATCDTNEELDRVADQVIAEFHNRGEADFNSLEVGQIVTYRL